MAVTCRFPRWRIVSTDLLSNVATILDKVASDRHVHPILNVPNWQSFTVPSDSPLVNIPFPGSQSDPYVSEGDRLIYWFRQESDTTPYFTCRAAGVSLQVEDSAATEDARTKVTSFDPWKIAYLRPAMDVDGNLPDPLGSWDGEYPAGTTSGEIVLDQLLNTISNPAPTGLGGFIRIDAGAAYGGTGFYTGTIEVTGALTDGFTVQPGQSVGDVWTAMVNTLTLDLILEPIFDPTNRPGYTHQLSIYAEAGTTRNSVIFGWDKAPHNLVNLSRMIDGTQRANALLFGAGQRGSGGVGTVQSDPVSQAKYGNYAVTQFFPSIITPAVVDQLAQFQLSLRANGKTTVQLSPAPNRSPCPFVDYDLGDHCFAYASAERFRQELSGEARIYGFPLDIADDSTEEVKGMVLLPEAA